jgi:RNA binding exosome subunit
MIDAEFRSEERFSRLSLAYSTDEEKSKVSACIDEIIAKHNIKPEMHTTKASNGKEILVIEYHDDMDRESGEIFEEVMCSLNIKECN